MMKMEQEFGRCHTAVYENGERIPKPRNMRALQKVGFPDNSAGNDSPCNTEDPGLIPESERSPGEVIVYPLQYSWSFLVPQLIKIHLQCERFGFSLWVGKIPWWRAWQPTPVFFLGESPQTKEPGRLYLWGH